jgi:3-methyladenine DNA glycosylase AlkD
MNIFEIFYENRDYDTSVPMTKYLKEKFPFLGIKKPERTALSKDFLKERKKDEEVDWKFIFTCFDLPEREFHYLAIDYMAVVKNLFTPDDMPNIEKLIVTKPWWDSIDPIANIVGHIALSYPEIKEGILLKWVTANSIWLNRVSIIFQVKLKDKTDVEFLSHAIVKNSDTLERFKNKAIGTALRTYSRTDPDWVREFLANNEIQNSSEKEASKYL